MAEEDPFGEAAAPAAPATPVVDEFKFTREWNMQFRERCEAKDKEAMEKKKELFGEVEMAVGGGPDLTESQQQGLVQIEKNQQEVDQILEMISSGIDDLQGMAEGMGDEIAKQNKMLDEVETTVDRTNEHMQKVQQKMHSTLQKTRGGDKFCMDMVLIFVIVAVGLLIVKLFTLRVCSETSA